MTNKMVIGYKFAFILLLLSSCVEDVILAMWTT